MYNCPPIPCGPNGMPYGGGGGGPMGPPPCPMNVMPMLPAYPQPRARPSPPPPSCANAEHNAKIIADVGAPFLEELAQLGECKKLTAEVNGKTYSLKLGCAKDKKRRRRSCSSSSSRGGSGSSQGVTFKCCDCNVPVPPGACQPDPDAEKMALAREEKMHKCLTLCVQMMREMFRRKYEEEMAENEDAIQMVEIPVMVMPGGMGGMPGMDMMGMGMGMGGMPPYMGGPGAPCGPEKPGPCGTCSQKPEKPKVVCKTNREQQCDESSLAPSKAEKKEGGKKGKKGKKK